MTTTTAQQCEIKDDQKVGFIKRSFQADEESAIVPKLTLLDQRRLSCERKALRPFA
jgi:hypothetical protein